MKLALVTETADIGRATRLYVRRTVEACAEAAGVEVEHVLVPAVTSVDRKPGLALLRKERPELIARLEAEHPDAVVSLGKDALNALSGSPKMVTLKAEHGRMRMLDLADLYLPEYRRDVPWVPGVEAWRVVSSSPDLHRDFAGVVYKAITQRAPLEPLSVETLVCRTFEDLSSSLALLEGATVVGVDVETTGLKPAWDELLAVGFGAVDGEGGALAVVVARELLQDVDARELMADAAWRSTRRAVGHNFKFDVQYLASVLGWPPGGASLGDTLLLAHLLDERPSRPSNRARGSGLKDLVAQRYDHQYGFDFLDFYQRADSSPDLWEAMHLYLGEDVAYTARLWHDLAREAEEEGGRALEAHDRLLMPAAVAVAKAEYGGAPVDLAWTRSEVARLAAANALRRRRIEAVLRELDPLGTVMNVLAPAQVADLVYGDWAWRPDMRGKHGGVDQSESVDAEHLQAAIAKYELDPDPHERRRARLTRALVSLRKGTRLQVTYEKSILGKVDPDGRLRASFLLHGASTGRLSSSSPNLQNVPAVDDRKEALSGVLYTLRDRSVTRRPMRRAFAPPRGHSWVEADYSQLELRVAAGVSGDQAFADVFRSGRDVHLEVASAIFSKPPGEVTKPQRYLAKAVAFGILYGRTAEAIANGAEMNYAESEGMTRWTVEVAEAFTKKFLSSYPALAEWMKGQHARVWQDRYVETYYGRRRRFPLLLERPAARSEIERQAVNTPIQATASDICLDAMTRITSQLEAFGMSTRVLFPVHDSICFEAPDEELKALESLCKQAMQRDFLGVPLTIDFEWGESWADTRKHG